MASIAAARRGGGIITDTTGALQSVTNTVADGVSKIWAKNPVRSMLVGGKKKATTTKKKATTTEKKAPAKKKTTAVKRKVVAKKK
jgi:hypothetical protein